MTKKNDFVEMTCPDCEESWEVSSEEAETNWNFKCPSCNKFFPGKKSVSIGSATLNDNRTTIKKGSYKKPNMNYLEKTYGDELHKPLDSFKKKKR
jgi:transposase-like protein